MKDEWPKLVDLGSALLSARPRVIETPAALGVDLAYSCVATGLPPLARWIVFETRLSPPSERVDLLVGLLADEATQQLATRARQSAPTDLVRTWLDEVAPLGVNVGWLEWDMPMDFGRPIFLGSLDPEFWREREAKPKSGSVVDRIVALKSMQGAVTSSLRRARLQAALDRLPTPCSILFHAWLGPRGIDAERLFVGMPRWLVAGWLTTCIPGCDRPEVVRWMREMLAPWETAWIQFEVDDTGARPYVAVETMQGGARAIETGSAQSFLEGLVEQGHAQAEHVRQLRAWPGESAVVVEGVRLTERRSYHVKAVFRPDASVELKAYYGWHYS